MTNPPIDLPASLRNPKFRFIRLGSKGQKLKVPIEMGWNIFDLDELKTYIEQKAKQWDADEASGKHSELKEEGQYVPIKPKFRGRLNNYSHDDPEFHQWLKRGNNYGVTGAGNLIKLESDDVDRWKQLGVIDLLPETLTIQSSSDNRQHFYFICSDVSDSPLFDPVTGEDIGHIRGTGDAKGRGGMVVGPGCLHPSGVRYTVVKDVPIAALSQEVLEKIKLILSKPKSTANDKHEIKSASNGQSRVADDTNPDPFRHITCTQVLGSGWNWHFEGNQKAGPNPYGNHSNKTGHNLVVNENDKQFYCFACQQGGGVSRLIAIKAGIIRCDQPGSPAGEDWWNTIRYSLMEGLIDETTAKAAGLKQYRTDKERIGQTLEDALLAMDNDCDGATNKDHKGFNKFDAIFGKEMASNVRSGLRLTPDEYKDIRKMLEKYNKQLVEHGIDVRLIPKKQPFQENAEDLATKKELIPPEIENEARALLRTGDCVQRRLNYIHRSVEGDCRAERVLIYCAYSAFLPTSDKLHSDIVGSPQVGKSKRVEAVLATMPRENVIMVTDASPKSLYYMSKEIDLEGKIVYIDDVREEHIPVLKTFRNDSSIQPRNISVNDGEFADMKIKERPIVLASSVQTMNDLEGQAISRSFLITLPDPTKAEEKRVRKKIRARLRAGALMAGSDDKEQSVLQQAARILRDEGIRSVLVPYDAEEPESADRRGTGQFVRLIKISAFMNQFQRPILEMADGTRHVLAIYKDLENAAEVWFDFETAQEFKIPAKGVRLIRSMPTKDPLEYGLEGTVSEMAKKEGMREEVGGEKTISRWLEDLYNASLVNRKQVKAPGNPWGYWIDADLRQRILSEIPTTGKGQVGLGHLLDKKGCLKYMAKKSPDSLLGSVYSFFTNKDIINRENIKGIIKPGCQPTDSPLESCLIRSYLAFWQKGVLNAPVKAIDSEYLGQTGLAGEQEKSKTKPVDSGNYGQDQVVLNGKEPVQAEEKVLGIRAQIQRDDEQNKEWEEHFKTPSRSNVADNNDNGHEEPVACPICGEDIGSGHSSRTFEGVSYCTSCATPLAIIHASAKSLIQKNDPLGPTTSDIFDDVAFRGSRPPLPKLLPGMLKALGFMEIEGKWSQAVNIQSQEKEPTREPVQKNKSSMENEEHPSIKEAVEQEIARLGSVGEPVVPIAIAEKIGCKNPQVTSALHDLDYNQTANIDSKTHMSIWQRKNSTLYMAEAKG